MSQMTQAQFSYAMDRIIDCYGDKAYPQVRVTAIHAWAKRMPSEVFDAVVDHLINESERAPMLAKFKDAYSIVKARFPISKLKVDCPYCDGSGFYAPIVVGIPTAYRCRCAAGDMVPNYVARWGGDLVRMVPWASEIMRPEKKLNPSSAFKQIEKTGSEE